VITVGKESKTTVVPSEAVQTGQQGEYAYVVKPDHTVEMRIVTAGRTTDRETTITKGIAPGETVVTDGQLRLAPGFRIEIVSARSGGAANSGGATP
jgi:multidrug efflux system membrane fusion protein